MPFFFFHCKGIKVLLWTASFQQKIKLNKKPYFQSGYILLL